MARWKTEVAGELEDIGGWSSLRALILAIYIWIVNPLRGTALGVCLCERLGE